MVNNENQNTPNAPMLFERDYKIESVSLSIKDITKLTELLEELTSEARKKQIDFVIGTAQDPKSFTRQDLEAEAEATFKTSHNIKDTTGRTGIAGVGMPNLESEHISDEIETIWLCNRETFQQAHNVLPRNYFDIFIDFRRTTLAVNFYNLPSNPSENGSCINIKGHDQEWVISAHQKLIEFFNKRKNTSGWLHKSGIYDIFLYLFVIPFLLFKAYQFEQSPSDWFHADSNVAVAAIFIYSFLLCTLIARQSFMFCRWLFPTVEYLGEKPKAATKYRNLIGSILVGLIIWGIQNFLSYIW